VQLICLLVELDSPRVVILIAFSKKLTYEIRGIFATIQLKIFCLPVHFQKTAALNL
jgi:hypothetical protein